MNTLNNIILNKIIKVKMTELQEIKQFNYKIILGFDDLQENLVDRIYKKLSEQDFYNTEFDVLNIINFKIKEILVSGISLVCEIVISASCNVPTLNKIIVIDNFCIKNNNIIYTSGRLQIIAKLNDVNNIEEKYRIKIEVIKIVAKNILCVASII